MPFSLSDQRPGCQPRREARHSVPVIGVAWVEHLFHPCDAGGLGNASGPS